MHCIFMPRVEAYSSSFVCLSVIMPRAELRRHTVVVAQRGICITVVPADNALLEALDERCGVTPILSRWRS